MYNKYYIHLTNKLLDILQSYTVSKSFILSNHHWRNSNKDLSKNDLLFLSKMSHYTQTYTGFKIYKLRKKFDHWIFVCFLFVFIKRFS